jgi:hypothetical protein
MGSSGQDLSLQTDPLTENAYTFVDGDPVNLFDPTGHGIACDNGGGCGNAYDATIREGGAGGTSVSRNSSIALSARAVVVAQQRHEAQTISRQQLTAAAARKPGFQDSNPQSVLPPLADIAACNADVPQVVQWATGGALGMPGRGLSSDEQSGLASTLSDPRGGCQDAAARSLVVTEYASGSTGVNAVDWLVGAGIYIASGGFRAADTWGNSATLSDHFARHGADSAATSEEEYASQASEFLQRSQADGLETKVDSNGIIRVYDPNTGEFGSYNPDGSTRTYFSASQQYFDNQPGSDPWSPKP